MSDKPTLDKDDNSSEWVLYLQQVLQSVGHWAGAEDGVFSDELEQAVQVLQDGNGLLQTGVVDDEVWALLERLQGPQVSGASQASAVQEDQQSAATSSYPTLSKGDSSSEWVQYLQQVLQSTGHWFGAADGVFGDELEQAVHRLQGSNGLAQNGVVDGGTWNLLDQLVGSASAVDPAQAQVDPAQVQSGPAQAQGVPAQAQSGLAQTLGDPAQAQTQHPASIPVDPGLEVAAGGHTYVIFTDEVRQGGSVSWRARNPGNIRDGSTYGAYHGKKVSAGSSGHFAVFPDEATGFAAIKSVLHHYGHVTVAQAMSKYAPASDHNDPVAYARHVAGQMGVPVTTYVDQLSDDQMTVFAEAIRSFEGWTAGHTFTLTDAALPDAVKKAINGN